MTSRPTADVQVKRRRTECAWNEQLCYTPQGRPQVSRQLGTADGQCFQDLDSNIERCGSCDGPDCTVLPFVNVSRPRVLDVAQSLTYRGSAVKWDSASSSRA